jgi:uncharacterized membrane protein
MTGIWVVIAALAVGTAAIRAAGPVLLGGRELPALVTAVIALLAPVVLAALVVTQTFSEDGALDFDPARTLGLAVAGVALALRVPLLAVVALAAATAALVRALA